MYAFKIYKLILCRETASHYHSLIVFFFFFNTGPLSFINHISLNTWLLTRFLASVFIKFIWLNLLSHSEAGSIKIEEFFWRYEDLKIHLSLRNLFQVIRQERLVFDFVHTTNSLCSKNIISCQIFCQSIIFCQISLCRCALNIENHSPVTPDLHRGRHDCWNYDYIYDE